MLLREIGIIRLVTIRINKPLMYNEYDLNGQEFDVLDVCKEDFIAQYVEMIENEKDKQYHKIISPSDETRKRFFNSKIFSMDPTLSMDEESEENDLNHLIEINLPIYNTKMDVHIGSADFSIDCVYISLLSISSILRNNHIITNDVYNDIRKQVKGIPVYNIKKDLKLKLLTTRLHTVLHDKPQCHFWRTVKLGVRLFNDGWRFNPDTIKYHKELYCEWIDVDYLSDIQNIAYFIKKMFNYGFATNKQEYIIMVEKVFHALSFNTKLIS